MKYLDYSKLAAYKVRHYPDDVGADYIDVRRFFGRDSLDPSTIQIRYDPKPFEIAVPIIDAFAREVASEMRSEGHLYDGPPAMKLITAELDGDSPYLLVRPTDYALQAGTCFALDLPHGLFDQYGGTLRNYYRHDCSTPSVDNNPLAICLGVCGCLILEDNGRRYLLAVNRSDHLASLGGTIGPSVAGTVDYSSTCTNLAELNEAALGTEVEEELNLKQAEFEIIPLAWAIELFRGERPQFFSLIRTDLNRDRIRSRLLSVPEREREFESFEFIPFDVANALDSPSLGSLNFEARMNATLVREYMTP